MSSEADGIHFDASSEWAATVSLDPRIYTREAILRACYWATGTAYVRVPESSEDRLVIHIKLKQKVPTLANPKPITIQEFVNEFCNSVVDFELRREIETETSKVRELILAKAFSESGVLEEEPPGTIADPVENRKPSSLVQLIAPVPPSNQ